MKQLKMEAVKTSSTTNEAEWLPDVIVLDVAGGHVRLLCSVYFL